MDLRKEVDDLRSRLTSAEEKISKLQEKAASQGELISRTFRRLRKVEALFPEVSVWSEIGNSLRIPPRPEVLDFIDQRGPWRQRIHI